MNEVTLAVAHRKGLAEIKRLPAIIKREVATARLPFNYVAAQTAVLECAKVDECKEWSNRAEAVASYARQIKDFTMGDNARRIILRATRRMGEVFEELQIENTSAIREYDRTCKKHKYNMDAPAIQNALSRTTKARDELAHGIKAFGNNNALRAAVSLTKVKSNTFEKHVVDSPVKTPHQVLVAEGLRRGNAGKSTPLHIFSKGLLYLRTASQRMSAADVAGFVSDTMDGFPGLKKEISEIRDWLDEIDQRVKP